MKAATLNPAPKPCLHPRNRHQGRYDFGLLGLAHPPLKKFVKTTPHGDQSIDFANAQAVKALNCALLTHHYGIADWDIPAGYLCPPIPGRADYLHYLADLLGEDNGGVIPRGQQVLGLDIGVGANAIYPLLGQREYGWRFVGADIDAGALANAQRILTANDALAAAIQLRRQPDAQAIFHGVIQPGERYHITLCNPPFHASEQDAMAGSLRKLRGLNSSKTSSKKPVTAHRQQAPVLNFGGLAAELYCAGGEASFIRRMVMESAVFSSQCLWFSTLVSKAATLPGIYRELKRVGALQVRTIDMAQGQKQSRLVAWSFLTETQRAGWYK